MRVEDIKKMFFFVHRHMDISTLHGDKVFFFSFLTMTGHLSCGVNFGPATKFKGQIMNHQGTKMLQLHALAQNENDNFALINNH